MLAVCVPLLALTCIGTTFPACCPGQDDNRKRGRRVNDFLGKIARGRGGKPFTT